MGGYRCPKVGCQYPPFRTSQALRSHIEKNHATTISRKPIRRAGRLYSVEASETETSNHGSGQNKRISPEKKFWNDDGIETALAPVQSEMAYHPSYPPDPFSIPLMMEDNSGSMLYTLRSSPTPPDMVRVSAREQYDKAHPSPLNGQPVVNQQQTPSLNPSSVSGLPPELKSFATSQYSFNKSALMDSSEETTLQENVSGSTLVDKLISLERSPFSTLSDAQIEHDIKSWHPSLKSPTVPSVPLHSLASSTMDSPPREASYAQLPRTSLTQAHIMERNEIHDIELVSNSDKSKELADFQAKPALHQTVPTRSSNQEYDPPKTTSLKNHTPTVEDNNNDPIFTVNCFCVDTRSTSNDIICYGCFTWQHQACIDQFMKHNVGQYLCHECRPLKSTTVIVEEIRHAMLTPDSTISSQISEFLKWVFKAWPASYAKVVENFRTLQFTGIDREDFERTIPELFRHSAPWTKVMFNVLAEAYKLRILPTLEIGPCVYCHRRGNQPVFRCGSIDCYNRFHNSCLFLEPKMISAHKHYFCTCCYLKNEGSRWESIETATQLSIDGSSGRSNTTSLDLTPTGYINNAQGNINAGPVFTSPTQQSEGVSLSPRYNGKHENFTQLTAMQPGSFTYAKTYSDTAPAPTTQSSPQNDIRGEMLFQPLSPIPKRPESSTERQSLQPKELTLLPSPTSPLDNWEKLAIALQIKGWKIPSLRDIYLDISNRGLASNLETFKQYFEENGHPLSDRHDIFEDVVEKIIPALALVAYWRQDDNLLFAHVDPPENDLLRAWMSGRHEKTTRDVDSQSYDLSLEERGRKILRKWVNIPFELRWRSE